MKVSDVSCDILTVSFDNCLNDKASICIARHHGGKINILKMEIGEQANILYQLLTDQMAKAEIKSEREE